MKLKGISKLILAGTALAATAATLTTSTYAWYVTNTTVDATSINGKVSGDSIDGSLFISENQVIPAEGTQGQEGYVAAHDAPKKYVTSIGFNAVQFTDLIPQSKATSDIYKYVKADSFTENTTYYTATGESVSPQPTSASDFSTGAYYTKGDKIADQGDWVDNSGKPILAAKAQESDPDVKEGKLITFKFWLRSSTNGTAAVKLVTDNKTVTPVQQQALAEGNFMPTGVTLGSAFTVDAVKALRMERIQQNGLTDTGSNVVAKTFAVDTISKDKSGATYASANTTAKTTNSITFATIGENTDANKYYWNVLGEAGYNTNKTTGASELVATTNGNLQDWATITLTANTDTLFTFNVWLEGSDADCFDSCRGQLFDFNFEFEFTKTNN